MITKRGISESSLLLLAREQRLALWQVFPWPLPVASCRDEDDKTREDDDGNAIEIDDESFRGQLAIRFAQ